MCFKNLPIEFDEQGNATLVLYPEAGQAGGGAGGLDAPERKPIEDNPAAIKELLVRNGWLTPEQAGLADDAQVSA
ncbi:MAG: hypothetical protein JWO90_422 [Solirubrobacterales bacterium]|jgi:hypothetical protein|nr:hypothetical protein [Solirubrobacterales bacterium]